ncbi:MAG: HEPN domain-containing protein [Endomicrobium sp.]|jgi:HEPN domain-containing protein|nr:HEPN domain-containing protein [Endomicrobium sp.]
MKKVTKEWIIHSQDDMNIVKNLFADGISVQGVIFHCQRAVEKYFKAFLLEHGAKFNKTHDLENLYKEVRKIKDFKLELDTIIELYKRYSDTIYPGDIWPPTQEEAREFYKFALEVEQKIKKELGA